MCVYCLYWSLFDLYIQGDSREKVNTLEGDSISHCEQKVHMNICPILNGYGDTAIEIK
jgi:hypothetical protein